MAFLAWKVLRLQGLGGENSPEGLSLQELVAVVLLVFLVPVLSHRGSQKP